MNRALQICLLVLASLAMGQVQIFGVQLGFVCLDGGRAQQMAANHCHLSAPTGDFIPCENRATSPDCPSGEISHHLQLTLELDASAPTFSDLATAPRLIPAMPVDVAAFQWLPDLLALEPEAGSSPYPAEAGLYPDTSVLIARCTVLLV
ncbi:MAG TPA: hypothetical protein VNQ90_15160 [Chthoniobacteraceae bacterium]|nr:hypothetical protein [Chthoniobacteraceae bacterium]